MKNRFLGLHWKEHLIYAALLLATGWFFQHKTTEQARLYGIMEEVFPLAAQDISTLQDWNPMDYIYLGTDQDHSNRGDTYRMRAKSIQKWVKISGHELERAAGIMDVEYQRKELAPLLEQLPHLPDSILLACDSDSAIGQKLRKIFPEELWNLAARHLPRAGQPELFLLINALRVRVELAANIGREYCFSRIYDFDYDYKKRYAHLPVFEARQSCPRVGELFEAEIYLDRYFTERDFEIMINGRRYVSDNGLVHFEERFARPGKYNLRVWLNRSDTGEKFELYYPEFEAAEVST